MASNDLGRRYPLVVLYLAFCGLSSAVQLCNWHNQAVYARVAVATMPLAFLIQLLAIVQVFWVIAGFVVAYGKWIQEECEKYQLPYFVRKGRFEEENVEILKKLMV